MTTGQTRRSAFKRWSPTDPMAVLRSSPKFQQHLLKAALFTVPRAHATKKEEVQIQYSNEAETSAQLYSGMRSFRGGPYSSGGSSISAHARNERNRRQKLHDRFMTLRSLVPNITKPDKVSLLGDAVLYVQDLHRRVTELEASKAPTPKTPTEPRVEVTIEKNTAYLKLSSPWQDGLIIHILERLHDFHLEVVDVSARVSHDAVLNAQLKAKVMSSTDGDDNDDDEEEVAKTASTIEATLLSTIANVMSSAR
uniref:BHLH domain-containing protein n=1 Tax=Physcomitrium patens TaxID=3218 RepID=A0A2K1JVY2_PHYPA|nr:hypothetical protein PHYPA_015452 [Physcomitrium patens]